MVLPVAPLVSPSHFGLRLLEREEEVCEEWPSISSIYPSACCSFLSPGVSPGRGYDCQSSWFRTRLDHWQESDTGTATQQPVVPRRGCSQDWRPLHNIQGRPWRHCYSAQELSSPLAPYLLQVECFFFSLSPVILDASCLLPGCLQLAFSAVWLEQTRLRVKTGVWSLLR